MDPPEKAVVLCVDEKSQVQALDRTALSAYELMCRSAYEVICR